MIKTFVIAAVYFLMGMGVVGTCSSEKKNDPGFVAFVLLFWPLIFGLLLLTVVLALVCGGLSFLTKKGRDG